jgi:hypothetical protein
VLSVSGLKLVNLPGETVVIPAAIGLVLTIVAWALLAGRNGRRVEPAASASGR